MKDLLKILWISSGSSISCTSSAGMSDIIMTDRSWNSGYKIIIIRIEDEQDDNDDDYNEEEEGEVGNNDNDNDGGYSDDVWRDK